MSMVVVQNVVYSVLSGVYRITKWHVSIVYTKSTSSNQYKPAIQWYQMDSESDQEQYTTTACTKPFKNT